MKEREFHEKYKIMSIWSEWTENHNSVTNSICTFLFNDRANTSVLLNVSPSTRACTWINNQKESYSYHSSSLCFYFLGE